MKRELNRLLARCLELDTLSLCNDYSHLSAVIQRENCYLFYLLFFFQFHFSCFYYDCWIVFFCDLIRKSAYYALFYVTSNVEKYKMLRTHDHGIELCIHAASDILEIGERGMQ